MVSVRRVLFTVLYRIGRGLNGGATLAFHAAAGLARVAELRHAIREEWAAEAERQSERYITSGLMEWEKALYFTFLRPDDRIMVIGCGTGRDLLALLERGYDAEGLDVVVESIGVADALLRKRGLRANLYTAPIETFELPKRFDAFILSYFFFGYVPESRTRIRLLRRLRAHLAPGGRILLSHITSDRLPRRLPVAVTRLVARFSGSDWRPEYGDVFHPSETRWFRHYAHLFPPGAVEAEAAAAGLRVVFHDPSDEGTAVLTE